MNVFALADLVASIVVGTWCITSITILVAKSFLGGTGDEIEWRILRAMWAELRPFYLPAVIVLIAHDAVTERMDGWRIATAVMSMLCWWVYKDVDDDDRWKRRKAKLAEKIERRGTRLVAVPVGGNR